MARKGESKWTPLLVDRDLKRWHDNLARGSPQTASVYLRALGNFLEKSSLTAKGVLELPEKERDNTLTDYVGGLADAGRAPTYVKQCKQAVMSWLSWNGQTVHRRI